MSETQLLSGLRGALIAHARRATPEEACGLLLGQHDRPTEVVRLSNHARQPVRHYALDPLEYMQVERSADQRGLAVVGVWHSHPEGGADPSETDRRAAWPGWLYVIVGLPASGEPEIRGWRLHGNRFCEDTLR